MKTFHQVGTALTGAGVLLAALLITLILVAGRMRRTPAGTRQPGRPVRSPARPA